MKSWSLVIDQHESTWEATLVWDSGMQYHYESSDPVTLMASVGRDLERDGFK